MYKRGKMQFIWQMWGGAWMDVHGQKGLISEQHVKTE
jgi:hypothetical protein